MSLEEYYNYLIDYEIVSQETLEIITNINGYTEETLDDILYCVSGYRNIEQYLEYEDKNTYNEYYGEEDEEDEE
jgi:hypothetical protein